MNGYKGETEIELYGRKYPMMFNMNVIAAFESNTGKDFNHTAIKAINAFSGSQDCEVAAERAVILTEAVSMSDAAWLFYLAAKESDVVVEFDEMQEAVMLEGFMARDDGDAFMLGYPLRFVQAVSFATAGVMSEIKKKRQQAKQSNNLEPSSSLSQKQAP